MDDWCGYGSTEDHMIATSRGRDRNLVGVWQIDRGISPVVRTLLSPCVGIPLPARNHFCSFHNALPRSGQR